MAFDLNNAYNKFAKSATSLNRGINKVIGKDIFQDVKELEEPLSFPNYGSFPEYPVAEPKQWTPLKGTYKEFSLDGNVITISENLDVCIQYRKLFKTTARYYTDRFIFKYTNCVQNFDSLIHYFEDLYFEGLIPMTHRAYSILLPFGVLTANMDTFSSRHINTYNKAVISYETMAGIEVRKNQIAENIGNQVGSSIQMQGGGLGFKGAMKGMAQAEGFNLVMGALGKFAANQAKMTKEDKEKIFSQFKQDVFFQEVYSDYFNTFLTMAQTLSENNQLDNIKTILDTEFETIVQNLQNPMFPQNKIVSALVKLISTYPFESACIELLQQKMEQSEEVNQIVDYFTV